MKVHTVFVSCGHSHTSADWVMYNDRNFLSHPLEAATLGPGIRKAVLLLPALGEAPCLLPSGVPVSLCPHVPATITRPLPCASVSPSEVPLFIRTPAVW